MRPMMVVRETGAFLIFDAILSESYTPDGAATTHPIEARADVTDHVQIKALSARWRVRVSETPIGVVSGVRGPKRILEAKAFLENARGKELYLRTSRGETIDRVLFARYPHEHTNRAHVDFDLEFTQTQIIEAGTAFIPPKAPPAATAPTVASTTELGDQAGTSTAAAPASTTQNPATGPDRRGTAYSVFAALGLI